MKVLRGIPTYYGMTGEDRGQPLYLTLNLDTTCSFYCIKCAQPGQPGQREDIDDPLSTDERERIIWLAAEAGVKALVIIGAGEPTENFEKIAHIVTAASRNGLDTVMFATSAGLTREQAEFFASNRTTIIISVDSLVPEMYRRVTGGGNLKKVLENITLLRQTFPVVRLGDNRVVRLGINVTVTKFNTCELEALKEFAGEDMFFVANPPIKRGKFANELAWRAYAGDAATVESLTQAAHLVSETGSHASVTNGVCGWFIRGIAIETDGALLSCGYAGDTAGGMQSCDLQTADDLIRSYRHSRETYFAFADTIGYKPSCPLRDAHYEQFVEQYRKKGK